MYIYIYIYIGGISIITLKLTRTMERKGETRTKRDGRESEKDRGREGGREGGKEGGKEVGEAVMHEQCSPTTAAKCTLLYTRAFCAIPVTSSHC